MGKVDTYYCERGYFMNCLTRSCKSCYSKSNKMSRGYTLPGKFNVFILNFFLVVVRKNEKNSNVSTKYGFSLNIL